MLKVEDLEVGSIIVGKSLQEYAVLRIGDSSVVCRSEYSHSGTYGVSGQSTFPIALVELYFDLKDKHEDTKQWIRGESDTNQSSPE